MRQRWWDDADSARVALKNVTDAGPGSVGAAVLGYHGVALEVLRPLASSTCVDAATVVEALHRVDVSDVAKAFASATADVMGDAAGAYGQLLADDLHERAVDGTTKLLLHLTNTGMDWPTALTRVSAIHGIPAGKAGSVVKRLKADRLSGMPLADVCDRALMDFAHQVAVRESCPVQEVSKQRMRQRDFDPDEHPRDQLGRFAEKNEQAERAERYSRFMRQKRARASAREDRRVRSEQQKVAARNDLVGLRSLLGEPKPSRQSQVASEDQRQVKPRRRAGLKAAARQRNTSDPMLVQPEPNDKGLFDGLVTNDVSNRFYTVIPKDVAAEIAEHGSFSIMWLNDRVGSSIDVLPMRQMASEVQLGRRRVSEDDALLIFEGDVAFSPLADLQRDTSLSPAGLYDSHQWVEDVENTVLERSGRHGLSMSDNPTFQHHQQFWNMVVMLTNPGQFSNRDKAARRRERFAPSDVDEDGYRVTKAGRRLREWDEDEHPRDEDGKFTHKRVGRVSSVDDRYERWQRYKRGKKYVNEMRQVRAERQAQEASAVRPASQQSLVGLRSLLAAPVVAESQPGEPSRRRRGALTQRAVRARTLAQNRESSQYPTFDPGMEAVVFYPGNLDSLDHAVFTDLFVLDPFTGYLVESDVTWEQRQELAYETGKRSRSLRDVVDNMHVTMLDSAGSASPRRPHSTSVLFEGNVFMSPDDADEFALGKVAELNARNPNVEWLPFATELPGVDGPVGFVGGLMPANVEESPILVIARDKDEMDRWREDPERFYLQTASEEAGSTEVNFDRIFEEAADDESWRSYVYRRGRPDFPVRTFWLKSVHNTP